MYVIFVVLCYPHGQRPTLVLVNHVEESLYLLILDILTLLTLPPPILRQALHHCLQISSGKMLQSVCLSILDMR